MDVLLNKIKSTVFDPCGFLFTNFKIELESKEYNACVFNINSSIVFSRTAKTTPKKKGQFVTFYKRNTQNIIEPFSEKDNVDFFLVITNHHNKYGFFVFPKSILIDKKIITNHTKEGKRAFRVYSPWDAVTSKQAVHTKKWQLNYFCEVTENLTTNSVIKLFDSSSS